MEKLAHDPADIPAPASYHWTARLQRDFLEPVATTGSVTISAARVGMSPAAPSSACRRPPTTPKRRKKVSRTKPRSHKEAA